MKPDMKIIICAAFLVLSACSTGLKEYDHKFKDGDCVIMKLDGRKGSVLSLRMYSDVITVRFVGDSQYAPLLGGKVNTYPYSVMDVFEHEVGPCK